MKEEEEKEESLFKADKEDEEEEGGGGRRGGGVAVAWDLVQTQRTGKKLLVSGVWTATRAEEPEEAMRRGLPGSGATHAD